MSTKPNIAATFGCLTMISSVDYHVFVAGLGGAFPAGKRINVWLFALIVFFDNNLKRVRSQ